MKPLIEGSVGLKAYRSKPLRGDILRQIITDLVVSPVVVADLTDNNPNVYWELGVRQSFKHGTITIAEEGTELPFDLSVKSTLFYCPRDHLRNAKFCISFKEAIENCLSRPDISDSHVLETLSGRGTLFEIFRRDEAIRRLEALATECNGNLLLLGKVMSYARNNQENPEKAELPTELFLSNSAELLITNRYIDDGPSLYRLGINCVSWIMSLNSQLEGWRNSLDQPTRSSKEKWLLQNEKNAKTVFNSFKNEVDNALKLQRIKF